MGDSAEKQKRPSFFKGAKAEFKKISWPDRQSTVLDYFIQYGVNFLTSL